MNHRGEQLLRGQQHLLKQIHFKGGALNLQRIGSIAAVCLIGVLTGGSMAMPVIGAEESECLTSAAVNSSETESEEDENALIEQALLRYANESGNILQKCEIGWYTEKQGYRTNSGFPAADGCTIRVNTAVIPLLSDVCIAWPDGTRDWYKASDGGETGYAVSIFTQSPENAQNSSQKAAVYWVPEGAIT